MKKSTKITLIVALVLVISGLVFIVAAWGISGFRGDSLIREFVPEAQEKTVTVQEPVSSLEFEDSACDLRLLPSSDGTCRVVLRAPEGLTHSVETSAGVLRITCTDGRDWTDYLIPSVNVKVSVTVYLPGETYESLTVSTASGDLSVIGLAFQRLSFSSTSGDLSLSSVKAGEMALSTSSGDLQLRDCTGQKATLSATSGEIELRSLSLADLSVDLTSGDLEAEGLICSGHISMMSTSGDLDLEKCDAASLSLKTSSGDVEGSFLSEKVFYAESASGSVRVPKGTSGGLCQVSTVSGDIELNIRK